MGPNGFGRKLGIGVRLGADILRNRAGHTVQSTAQVARRNAPVYAERKRALARGGRKFGESFWRPFAHASSVLWLEVTGLFFSIFALFFVQSVYRLRHAYRGGPEHQRFLLYAVLAAAFLYFTFSSFYSARKKEKLKRSRTSGAPGSRN